MQDIMRGDAGVGGDEQRLSQIVWILFLKIFDYKEEEWELTQDNIESMSFVVIRKINFIKYIKKLSEKNPIFHKIGRFLHIIKRKSGN